eukprot:997872-Alexandrium_andersonii.AAC.1
MVSPVWRGWVRSTPAGPSPRTGVPRMAVATTSAVAGLGSAMLCTSVCCTPTRASMCVSVFARVYARTSPHVCARACVSV